jgi:hypothetical protein
MQCLKKLTLFGVIDVDLARRTVEQISGFDESHKHVGRIIR